MATAADKTIFDPTAWLEKKRIEKKMSPDQSSTGLPTWLLKSPAPSLRPSGGSLDVAAQVNALASTSLYEKFEHFLNALVLEQMKKPEELLKLNSSRRESLARFLSELSRDSEPSDPQDALKRYVRVDRSENEHESLKQLFKQISIVQIAKAFLLKSWNVHHQFSFERTDLKDLTAAVEKGLRPFIHLQTSTCQLTQRNFYSWYKMSHESQEALWALLAQIQENPTAVAEAKEWLLSRAIQLSAETLGERDRYSKSFYQNIWNAIGKNKIFIPQRETHYGFSPTLRDGSLMESAPAEIEWIGFEPLSFELLFCEIRYLWKQPKAPQMWVKGSGLEMSMEQQANMLLTSSGKQNVLQQLDAISCCEIAFIAEESLIRTQARSLAAQALRKLVDTHSILKKIKQPTTTRGMYQACQALEKLRQGGTLVWAREELLTETSGKPALQFILNQAKILMIADFTSLECESDPIKRDLPKVLYLLKKETSLEARKSHRPLLIKAYGSLKTANDVSVLFDRVMSLVQKPEQIFPPEPFDLHARVSPMDQREWEQHWFNPTDDQLVDRIEDLKRSSTPLGQLAIIRPAHPLHQNSSNELTLFSNPALKSEQGFYAWCESNKNGNEIFTAELSQLPEYMKGASGLFWIAPIQKTWSAPLQMLIRSQLTRDWFNYSVERKKGTWLLKEQDFKAIPIPKHISDFLLAPVDHHGLPLAEQKALQQIATEPGQAMKDLETLFETNPALKAHSFTIAAQVFRHLESHQSTLFSLISLDEQICYPKLFHTVMTEQDLSPMTQHPLIRFTSSLPANLAIQQMSLVKFPSPGILLVTTKGLSQQLYIQDSWLRERCFEMMNEVKSQIAEPTWGELCQFIKLPKNPSQAQSMGNQIMKAHSEEKMKRKELNHLLGACLMSDRIAQSKVGLLQ
jgi:hypothetical protein